MHRPQIFLYLAIPPLFDGVGGIPSSINPASAAAELKSGYREGGGLTTTCEIACKEQLRQRPWR